MIVPAKNTQNPEMIKKVRDKISLNIGHDDEDDDTKALVSDEARQLLAVIRSLSPLGLTLIQRG